MIILADIIIISSIIFGSVIQKNQDDKQLESFESIMIEHSYAYSCNYRRGVFLTENKKSSNSNSIVENDIVRTEEYEVSQIIHEEEPIDLFDGQILGIESIFDISEEDNFIGGMDETSDQMIFDESPLLEKYLEGFNLERDDLFKILGMEQPQQSDGNNIEDAVFEEDIIDCNDPMDLLMHDLEDSFIFKLNDYLSYKSDDLSEEKKISLIAKKLEEESKLFEIKMGHNNYEAGTTEHENVKM